MKYVLGLGLLIVGGALASGACTQSDNDGNANDRRSSSGGDGGTTASGGNGGDGGTAGGSGGYDTGGSGGTGGYDATGGSAGEGGWNAAGAAGENGMGGSGASGGSGGDFCAGDDELNDLPDCDDLPYAATTCSSEVPIGVSLCQQYAENATDEAFAAVFECLDELTVDCDDLAAHSEGVRDCTVSYFPCETELAVEKCEAFGCDAIEEDLCLAFLSSFTDDGVQSVIDCSNEATQTPAGSPWGGSSEVIECDRAFLDCFSLGTAE